MFTRFLRSLKSMPRSTPRYSFSSIPPLQTLANYFSEGHQKLSNPSSFQEALQSFTKLKSLSEDLYPTKPMQKAFWLSQISYSLASNGYLEQSRTYYEEVKNLISQLTKTSKYSTQSGETYETLVQITVIYKDYVEAEKYFSQALEYVKTLDNLSHVSLLEKMIVPKVILGKANEGLELTEKILELIKEVPNNVNLKNEVLIKQAKCYIAMMQLEIAKEIIEEVIELTKEKYDKQSLMINVTSYELLSEIYAIYGMMNEAVSSALIGGKILNEELGADKTILYYSGVISKLKSHPASEEIVDQLIKMIESVDENNSDVLGAYKIICGVYFNVGNYEESIKYAEKSIKIIKKMNNFDELIDAYFNAAQSCFDYDIEKAKEYIDLANAMYESQPNKKHEKNLKYMMFNYYFRISEYELAEKEIGFCIDNTPESFEDFDDLVNYYMKKSFMYYYTQKSEKCIECDLKTIKLVEQYEEIRTDRIISIYGKIGSSYARLGNYEKALEYLFKAVDDINDNFYQSKVDYLFIYFTLMTTYSGMNQFSIALEHANEILPLVQASSQIDEMTLFFYIETGNIYEKIMNKQKAKEFFLKAKELLLKVSYYELLEQVEERLDNLDK